MSSREVPSPIFVALGANLSRTLDGTPLRTCQESVGRLDTLPGLRVVALSRWYRTDPIPASDQPSFVNGVVQLRMRSGAPCDPAALLAALHRIEAAFGRQRGTPNAARTLDLDLVAIGDRVRQRPDPILPHPRAHLRAFVLAPLADLAPDWRHPVIRRTVREMLAGVSDQGVTVIDGA